MSRPKVAFLSDGYTEEFCIAEGETYPEVKGTFRPRTNLQQVEHATKALALSEADAFGAAILAAEIVGTQIQSWDIVDENGDKVEPTATAVEKLPSGLIELMFKAITSSDLHQKQEADAKN